MPITQNTLDLESIQTFSGFEHLILFFQVYYSMKAFWLSLISLMGSFSDCFSQLSYQIKDWALARPLKDI